MSKESHMIVGTWAKIAEYTPFKAQSLRKRFGKEMKDLSVVYRNAMPGRMKKGPIIWGVVWKIEKYMDLKAKRGELGMHNATRRRNTNIKPLDKL